MPITRGGFDAKRFQPGGERTSVDRLRAFGADEPQVLGRERTPSGWCVDERRLGAADPLRAVGRWQEPARAGAARILEVERDPGAAPATPASSKSPSTAASPSLTPLLPKLGVPETWDTMRLPPVSRVPFVGITVCPDRASADLV